ncbi:hypothetical protein AB0G15_36015 [Streptosporangium sp. NPDC023825]|uniref:hypothetical protein n=1 Tax=Streptosporangium sp. NPDC023825 TaxID=3154909 RepID=UPI00344848E1
MATDEERTRWIVHGERPIHDNGRIRPGPVDVEIPDRERSGHHTVHPGRAATTVPVDDQNRVPAMWRHRFPFDRRGWIPRTRTRTPERSRSLLLHACPEVIPPGSQAAAWAADDRHRLTKACRRNTEALAHP